MRSLILATGHLLILIIIIKVFIAPESLYAQEQYFVDETSERLPQYEDRSLDGDLGDVNSNGLIDLVISNGNLGNPDTSNLLLINTGNGFFEDSTTNKLPTITLAANYSTLIDIENDRDYDIYVSNFYDRDFLFTNDGSGNFRDESGRIPLNDDSKSTDAVCGDVDADIDVDIVVSEFNWRFNRLLINNGNGFFSYAPPSQFPSEQENSSDGAIGDVDGDFDLDVVFANDGARNVILINEGNGSFRNETEERMPDINQVSTSVSFADVDNDSDLDIFVTNGFLNSMNRLLINNGSGYFTDESVSRIPLIGDISIKSVFGDIDNDNDLDIVVANDAYQGAGYTNRLYVNDGNGYFSDETQERLPDSSLGSNDAVLGDVDIDGDLDLIIINRGDFPNGEQNRLFINVSTPDSFPPTIPRTYHHPDTGDTTNPYLITTTVWDNISVVIGELKVSHLFRGIQDTSRNLNMGEFIEIPMLDCGGFLYRERIPAQQSGTTVEYYIKAEDRMGNISYDPPNAPDSVFSFLVDVSLGINDNPNFSPNLPKTFSLSQNYPNPFNPSTTISFDIPRPVGTKPSINLTIYDLRGRRVRTLLDSNLAPGSHKIHWDGRNNRGEAVSSGIYLYTLRTGEESFTRKMTVLK